MKLLKAIDANRISEDANVEKYKQEIEKIFTIIKDRAEQGEFDICLSEPRYINAILKNKSLFEEGGYHIDYYNELIYIKPFLILSWRRPQHDNPCRH